jgi:hypothetical protein
VLKAYDMGSSALKHLLSDEMLQPENIDKVMLDIQDTYADQEEVSAAIHLGNQAISDQVVDEEALEQEYKELLLDLMPTTEALPAVDTIQSTDETQASVLPTTEEGKTSEREPTEQIDKAALLA